MRNNPERLEVGLISLARRGGMFHYHTALGNALAPYASVYAFISEVIPPHFYHPDIKLIRIPTGNSKIETLIRWTDPKVYKVLSSTDCDIFHFTGPHEWNNQIYTALSILNRKPVVYTIHDEKYHPGTSHIYIFLDKVFRRFPKGYVVHSEEAKKVIRRSFGGKLVCKIPMIIASFFDKCQPTNHEEKNQILFIGRLEKYKGIEIFCNSALEIIRTLPTWEIIIAGEGNLKYHSLLSHQRIKILNRFLTDHEFANLINEAKIVVFPYTSATSSGVIPVAWYFKKAIVVSDVSPFNLFIQNGETGLVVPPNDSMAFRDAVVNLAQNEELMRKLGSNGQKYLTETHNPDAIAKLHLEFYHRILSKKSG